ncbi:MAG: chromosome segregation protein SMC [Polyangiaceae bacterium]|nr:chromosome segregation protein SMC [Polyangiaceae bacterium]
MRIRKLEISGFKSFCDRTVIHFDTDVIGIVGPNGCGKSNIVDSIRWCMGEQSAKHLRGRAMTDVIFSGSETRGPHGLAEVTMTFDNTDAEAAQLLPLEYRDYAEIAVTRRLYRDGTSEYLINKTVVRLKDVTDLFLGTGVGTKAYAIIEQGKIGLIVSARPEDRRMLIEEAAGITKYKARKKQAEQKIEQTRQNLLRVGDIVAEIERSLASLKRQAAKAERYVNYRRELEDLTLHEASHKLLELIALTKVEEAAVSELSEKVRAERAALDAREAELEVIRQTAHTAEEHTEAAQRDAFLADNEVRTHETEIGRSRDKLHSLDERRRAAMIEQVDLERTIGELITEKEQLEGQLSGAAEEETRESEQAMEEHERLEELRAGERAASDEVNRIRKDQAMAAAAVAAAEATLTGFERRLAEMSQRRVKLEDELGRLSYEVEDVERRRAQLAKDVVELAEGKRMSAEERTRLDAEMKQMREQAVTTDKAVDQAKNDLSHKRNRLRALEELHARLDGVGAGTKSLLRSGQSSLRGLVADRIEAPADLTHAFAGLMGDRLQCIVTTDPEKAVSLLHDLAKQKKGRATMIAARPPYVAGGTVDLTGKPGVICRLVDRLLFDDADEPLVHALIGDAVVVERAEDAFALLAGGVRVPLVAMDGTVVHPDGRVSGGQEDQVAAGMIEHKREIRELHETVAKQSDNVTKLLDSQQALRLRMTEVGAALERARNEAHQGELALLTAEKDLKRAEEQFAGSAKRREVVREDLDELTTNLEVATGDHEAARDRLEGGKEKLEQAAAGLDHAEQVAADWRERVLGQQSVVTDRKVRLARIRERAGSLRQTVDRLSRSCDELKTRITRLDDERNTAARGAGEAAAKMLVSRELLVASIDRAQKTHQRLTDARQRLESARQELSGREQDLRGLRASVEQATVSLRDHELKKERLAIEHTHLVEGVREKFRGLDIYKVAGDYHRRPLVDANHKNRIVELTDLIDRMGPVNVDAMREHAEAEERHTYYASQKADLEKAIDDLEKAIQQMNRESKRLFKQTFDGVNMRFKTLFPKMFRGGAAELRLTNPDDLLETGIEILAQPPGKKLGNIELMSGGEKALTAVSLIFAIFQYKPSPFCILDEVDAPLDEANVTRYNEAIRSMTDHSQFILITHIKRTMQSVDVLYGVTMQEAGVSKIVSVKVNDTAPAVKPNTPAAPATAVA